MLVAICLYVDSDGSPYWPSSSWSSSVGMTKQSGSQLPYLRPIDAMRAYARSMAYKGLEPMSWKAMNAIIGRAAVDPDFCQDLLAHPLNTAQKYGFELTLEERELLATIKVQSLCEFSKLIVDKLTPDQ